MSISTKIKTLLVLSGKEYAGLAARLGISRQALSNKFIEIVFQRLTS